MSTTFPWGRKSALSIGGIEVVPASGLEVAYDDSPEVAEKTFVKPRRKWNFPGDTFKRIEWRRSGRAVPGFWMGMGIAVAGICIAAGVIFALVAGVKAKNGKADR